MCIIQELNSRVAKVLRVAKCTVKTWVLREAATGTVDDAPKERRQQAETSSDSLVPASVREIDKHYDKREVKGKR